MRCEGYRRNGGAFSLGPVTWLQCENEATVTLKIVQDEKTEEFPACKTCWNECIENSDKIEIKEVKPL